MPDLLDVKDLVVEFPSKKRGHPPLRAVDGVSFSVPAGQTVAIVGESGSGKTTVGRAILGLQRITKGEVVFDGHDIATIPRTTRRKVAKDLQVIFQNPIGSLNPALTVGATIIEPMLVHHDLSRSRAHESLRELIRRVSLPEDAAGRYPGQFSGGQRQRIAIARALAIGPKLVICDEPTSALDVSTQAQVLSLLRELREQLQLSYLFISHDLAVVREFADHVLVMRKGQLVEQGTAEQICERPEHPYTQLLVAAAPVPHPVVQAQRRQARLTRAQALLPATH